MSFLTDQPQNNPTENLQPQEPTENPLPTVNPEPETIEVVATPANEPLPTEDELQEAEKKTSILSAPAKNAPVTANKKSKPEVKENSFERFVVTTGFNGESAKSVKHVADARIAAGESDNYSHYLAQCVDLANNLNEVKKQGFDVSFAVPDDYEAKLLKNGYYSKFPNIKIPRCK